MATHSTTPAEPSSSASSSISLHGLFTRFFDMFSFGTAGLGLGLLSGTALGSLVGLPFLGLFFSGMGGGAGLLYGQQRMQAAARRRIEAAGSSIPKLSADLARIREFRLEIEATLTEVEKLDGMLKAAPTRDRVLEESLEENKKTLQALSNARHELVLQLNPAPAANVVVAAGASSS